MRPGSSARPSRARSSRPGRGTRSISLCPNCGGKMKLRALVHDRQQDRIGMDMCGTAGRRGSRRAGHLSRSPRSESRRLRIRGHRDPFSHRRRRQIESRRRWQAHVFGHRRKGPRRQYGDLCPMVSRLQNGHPYEIAVFQAERQSTGSSFKLALTGFTTAPSRCLRLQPTPPETAAVSRNVQKLIVTAHAASRW